MEITISYLKRKLLSKDYKEKFLNKNFPANCSHKKINYVKRYTDGGEILGRVISGRSYEVKIVSCNILNHSCNDETCPVSNDYYSDIELIFKELSVYPENTTIKNIRNTNKKLFKKVMLKLRLAEVILDLRIAKYKKAKREQLLRDLNYKELFYIDRVLELHSDYFDII